MMSQKDMIRVRRGFAFGFVAGTLLQAFVSARFTMSIEIRKAPDTPENFNGSAPGGGGASSLCPLCLPLPFF